MQFPKTILMIIMYAVPLVVFFFVLQLMPLSLLFDQCRLPEVFLKRFEETPRNITFLVSRNLHFPFCLWRRAITEEVWAVPFSRQCATI